MGMVHYVCCKRTGSREMLLRGEVPKWIANRKGSQRYISQVVLSAPPWVDRKALMALHEKAQLISGVTCVLHVLNHIVPLNHPRVCGLTVPWNLEIITNHRNNSLGNRWCGGQAAEQLELQL